MGKSSSGANSLPMYAEIKPHKLNYFSNGPFIATLTLCSFFAKKHTCCQEDNDSGGFVLEGNKGKISLSSNSGGENSFGYKTS